MASKRRIRRRSCERKVRQHTEAAAKHHARSLFVARGEVTYAYACSFCGGWHVGRRAGHGYHGTVPSRVFTAA